MMTEFEARIAMVDNHNCKFWITGERDNTLSENKVFGTGPYEFIKLHTLQIGDKIYHRHDIGWYIKI